MFLAAVGPLMTEVAGEVADGMIAHAFTTERYLREVTLPALERGLAKAGRKRADFQLAFPGFIVTGANEKAWIDSRTRRVQADRLLRLDARRTARCSRCTAGGDCRPS